MINKHMWLPLFSEDSGASAGASDPTAAKISISTTGTGTAATDPGNGAENTEPKSFEDVLKSNSDFQAELDRRINAAVEKATTKERDRQKIIQDRFQDEVERVSQMTEEEKAAYFKQKQEKEAADREADLVRRELTLDARSALQDKHLPETFLDLLDYSDKEACMKSVSTLEAAFNTAVQIAVEDKLKGGKAPKDAETEGKKADPVTAQQKALEEAKRIAGLK